MNAIKLSNSTFAVSSNRKQIFTPGRRVEMRTSTGVFAYSDVNTAEYYPSPENRTVVTIVADGVDPINGDFVPDGLSNINFGHQAAPNFGGPYPTGAYIATREGSQPRDGRYYTKTEVATLGPSILGITFGQGTILAGTASITVPVATTLKSTDILVVMPREPIPLYVTNIIVDTSFDVSLTSGVAAIDIPFDFLYKVV